MHSIALSLSIGLQFCAAVLALWQLRFTKRKFAWSCIATALILMGIQRGATLYDQVFDGPRPLHDPIDDLVLIFISSLMIAGVILIGRLFREVEESRSALESSEQRFKGLFDHSEVSIWNEDLSEVKRSLNKLRASGITDLRKFLEENQQVAWDMSRQVKVLQVNPATLKLFGAKAEPDLIEKIDKTFGPGAIDVFTEELCAIWDDASSFQSEATYRTLDGRDLTAIISFHMPKTAEAFASVPVSIVDITDRKHMEAKIEASLIESQRSSQAKSEFLANMSHEIRTPLNGVLGMTEILLSSDLDPDAIKKLEVIKECGESLLALLEDILDLSKLEAGQIELVKEDVEIRKILESVMSVFPYAAAEKGNTLNIEIDAAVPSHIGADPARLRQVLLNLIGNAMKFTDGGSITAGVAVLKDKPGFVEFSVIDTGIGIAADHKEAMFDRFRQADQTTARQHGGAGLGLAISRQFIDLMGGYIDVDSEQGHGSRFYFGLPIAGM